MRNWRAYDRGLIARGDLVRGYEFKKDTYVLLDDADFERAKIDTVRRRML